MRSGFEIFRLADERTPNRPAIVDRGAGRELSYGDLADEIETVAAGFAARGVGRSSRRAVGRTRMVRDAADLGGALAGQALYLMEETGVLGRLLPGPRSPRTVVDRSTRRRPAARARDSACEPGRRRSCP